ncbi:MAG: RNA polymerase sigma factor [Flavobacteriales bacterium]|jgi:RNA polymerase sigma factor (sigma-70 family)
MSESEFEEIYHQNKQPVFHVVLSYLKNRKEAEDVVQQVFVKVFKKIDQFEERSQLKTWIYKISITTSLDAIKSKKRKKRFGFFTNNDVADELNVVDNAFLPNEEIENSELLETLLVAINKLAEPQRTVFYLSQVDGLGNIEISEIVNKSVGAVESTLHRAKDNMRKELSSFYDEYRRNS